MKKSDLRQWKKPHRNVLWCVNYEGSGRHFRNGQGLFAPDSTIRNVVMCFAGGALFRVGLGAISSKVLQKTSLGYKI